MKKLVLSLSVFGLFAQQSYAQCTVTIAGDSLVCVGDLETYTATTVGPSVTLMASNTAGNNHRGNMFDIVATNDVHIISFNPSPMGNTTIEVYYKVGTWNGFANTPSAWTFLSSTPVTYTGGFTTENVPVNVLIPAGQTYAFYVTSTMQAVALNYSNGTNVGNVYSSDANITFLEGGGMEYPFTQNTDAVYQPRVWNGNINYALANVPTTFAWNTSDVTNSILQTITAPTQFTVESTIAGCPTLRDTMNVNVSIPTVSAGSNQQICLGDSLFLAGTGAATYAWDNSVVDSAFFFPSTIGTTAYTVIGTDSAGCADTASMNITVNPLPVVSAGGNQNVCLGKETRLSGSGADSYIWDNGIVDDVNFSPSQTLNYAVVGTDTNGCIGHDTVSITVIPSQVAIVSQIGNTLISNAAHAYQWINCDTQLPLEGDTIQLFTAKENGNYALIIENEYGCADTSACFTITSIGIENVEEIGLTVFPNPTNGIVTINTSNVLTNAVVEVYSSVGQIIYANKLSGQNVIINLGEQPNGVYFVKIQSGKTTQVEKIVKY